MKSICTYLGDIALFPHFTFTFDDHEKELIKGLFDLQIKRLIARRRVLLNKLKKDFEAEEKFFFEETHRLSYPFRYTLWEKKRDDKRLDTIETRLEWDKTDEGDEFCYRHSMMRLANCHHLHNYRLYRELQMHKIREYERAVKKLDIEYMRKLFKAYEENPKNVYLSGSYIKIFLIDYILKWSMSKEYCSKHEDIDLVLLKKVKDYIINLRLKDRIKLMLIIEEIDHFVFVEVKDYCIRGERFARANPDVVY